MEGIEGHLGGGLAQGFGRNQSDGMCRLNQGVEVLQTEQRKEPFLGNIKALEEILLSGFRVLALGKLGDNAQVLFGNGAEVLGGEEVVEQGVVFPMLWVSLPLLQVLPDSV